MKTTTMKNIRYSKPIDLRKFNRDNDWHLDIASKHKALAGELIGSVVELNECPICVAKESKHLISVYNYPYHECGACGHLYSATPPNPDALAALYTEDSKGRVLSSQGEIYIQEDLFEKRVEEIALPKAKFVADCITKRGKWIDIGAGVGDLALAAGRLGWDAVGYESDIQEVEFAKQMGANIEQVSLCEKNMSIISDADIVSTINVLEHILDPKAFVRSIADAIVVGTYFLFEVPRFPSISSLANICFPEYAARNLYSPDHLHLFTDKSMSIILKEAGLDYVATWFFGQDIYELIRNCLVKGNFSDHALIEKALSITNDLQEIVDKQGLADTMLVLTRKVK